MKKELLSTWKKKEGTFKYMKIIPRWLAVAYSFSCGVENHTLSHMTCGGQVKTQQPSPLEVKWRHNNNHFWNHVTCKVTNALQHWTTWGLVWRKMKMKWKGTVELENFKRCFCVDILITILFYLYKIVGRQHHRIGKQNEETRRKIQRRVTGECALTTNTCHFHIFLFPIPLYQWKEISLLSAST